MARIPLILGIQAWQMHRCLIHRLPASIKVFRDILLRDLDRLKIKNSKMIRDLELGLDQLCKRKDLVVRPADKEGGIVVLNKSDYLHELDRILGDRATYTPLKSDPRIKYRKELERIVDHGFELGIINKKEKLFLIPASSRIPIIYYLPKIHKDPVHPPRRPIIRGILHYL